jgi:rSAM/selenodomain-associated transferase 1
MFALVLMAKAPLSGLAKTRLVAEGGLSADDAARFADAFLRDTLLVCERVGGARLIVCFAPSASEPYFRELAPRAHLIAQVEGDLGARMAAACEAAFALGATRIALIGADTPHLAAPAIERAWRELERCDCVLGPAEDGGYYLIALRERRPELFQGIEWSTPRVLEQTLSRAREAGAHAVLLEELFDIDDVAALGRLERSLGPDGEPCPHTARVLADRRASQNSPASWYSK